MKAELFNQYALYWAGGFLLIYVLVQLLVAKHPRFQFLSALQKSLLVKVMAIGAFGLVYVLFQFLAV
ncbi:MAG: hypothetical protein Q7T48_13630 [Cellvibrio sp.]|uniref:hypothetical protein n=1 Tax=Cellvibrio sp. TaxID=1965322 RepID=UPI00271B6321|nr:hypothetical protein [Cellvibrio sp.]